VRRDQHYSLLKNRHSSVDNVSVFSSLNISSRPTHYTVPVNSSSYRSEDRLRVFIAERHSNAVG